MTDAIAEAADELPPSLTVTFKSPALVGSATYDHVDLREPTVGEMDEALSKPTSVKQVVSLISKVGGIPEAAVRSLKVTDYNLCRDYLMGFINASEQAT